jgi:hypothetical protein
VRPACLSRIVACVIKNKLSARLARLLNEESEERRIDGFQAHYTPTFGASLGSKEGSDTLSLTYDIRYILA